MRDSPLSRVRDTPQFFMSRLRDMPQYFVWSRRITSATYRNTLQHSVLQCVAVGDGCQISSATHFNTLQHSVLQCVAVGDGGIDNVSLADISQLQHSATHCNTLQHTATHCNTLQHYATHSNTRQHTVTLCIAALQWMTLNPIMNSHHQYLIYTLT